MKNWIVGRGHFGNGGDLRRPRHWSAITAFDHGRVAYLLFSSTSTYSASMTLSSPPLEDCPPSDALAADACSAPPSGVAVLYKASASLCDAVCRLLNAVFIASASVPASAVF